MKKGNPLVDYFSRLADIKRGKARSYAKRLLQVYGSKRCPVKISEKVFKDGKEKQFTISGAGLKKSVTTERLNHLQSIDFFRRLIHFVPVIQKKCRIISRIPEPDSIPIKVTELPHPNTSLYNFPLLFRADFELGNYSLDFKVEHYDFKPEQEGDQSDRPKYCPQTYTIRTSHGDWSLEIEGSDPRYFSNVYELDRYWKDNYRKCEHPLGSNWNYQEIEPLQRLEKEREKRQEELEKDKTPFKGDQGTPDAFKKLHKRSVKMLKSYKSHGEYSKPARLPFEDQFGTILPAGENDQLK